MRRQVTVILLLLAILLFPSGCRDSTGIVSTAAPTLTALPHTPTPQPTPTALPHTPTLRPAPTGRASSDEPAAVLTCVQGEVHLQQVATGQLVRASFGGYLWRGDVIVAKQDAQAEAVCNDGQVIRVAPDQSLTVTCGEMPDPIYRRIILRIHGEQIEALSPARLDPPDYDSLPVVLSPRNSKLIDGRPAICWLPVEEAEEYEVIVRRLDSELWRVTTRETELPYPKAQPALEAGGSYLIDILARKESDENSWPSERVSVTMLSAADAEQVRQFEAQVEALDLSAEAAHFFLAAYYADQELCDAAIAELVLLVKEAPSAMAHRLLGDVYLAVVLDDDAARSYEEASRLAQAQSNRLIRAEAEVGLGHVASAAEEFGDALSHYQAALTLYRDLGLENNVEDVKKLAADTKARISTPNP